MKKTIQQMDEELEDFHKKNKQLQLDIQQLQSKQKLSPRGRRETRICDLGGTAHPREESVKKGDVGK